MGPHGGGGIGEGGAILDSKSVNGIGVVAAPDLGGVVEHTHIKTSAAAGTAFNEGAGTHLSHPLKETVYPQYIAVVDLPLPLTGQGCRPDLGQSPVHIPLQIGDVGGF